MNSTVIMLWCCISKDRIIRPFEIENGNVTGDTYRNMLIRKVLPRLQTQRLDFVFQQDGAQPHRATRMRAYLNRKCSNYRIGRQGPVHWLARSQDLTPCDFFLWGHIKAKVYDTSVPNIEEMQRRIKLECRRVRPETLAKVWDNLKLRLNYLTKVNGEHIESLIS